MYLLIVNTQKVKYLYLPFILAEIICYMEMKYVFYLTEHMYCHSAYFCENNFPIYLTHIFINIIKMSILYVTLIWKSHLLKK